MHKRPLSEQVAVSRRRFVALLGAVVSGAAGLLAGCVGFLRPDRDSPPSPALNCVEADDGGEGFDYVVVGSGAGGGPLASRLALAGYRVLLLEAGGEDEPYDYQVPAFHPRASENKLLAWSFFVRHYGSNAQQARDEKFVARANGVLYPRAATVGGCTAHNALILIYPHNSDWDHIAEITGDASWSADNMRPYFQRLERCEYVAPDDTASRHGFKGWLTTNVADPLLMVRDRFLLTLVGAALRESLVSVGRSVTQLRTKLYSHFDPNDWRLVKTSAEGVCLTPLSVDAGKRTGSRELIRQVRQSCPQNLVVWTHCLATRVLLDKDKRATGVEYLRGAHLYAADPGYKGGDEISVVTRMKGKFSAVEGMKFRPPRAGEEPDPQFRDWLRDKGPYTTNGAVVSLIKRSFPDRPEPDLYIFGLTGYFKGYYPGYSRAIARGEDYFTWAILKAHSNNRAGRVTLRSKDPRQVPEINFHYFGEGTGAGDDLESVVAGVQTVRRITARCRNAIEEEVLPGPDVATTDQIRLFVRDNAWGHHASCTCKMGPASDPTAVVDSRFRVHGTRNLRVVDAAVFPRIPGFFSVSAVYRISEKASDVIVEDAKAGSGARVRV
ncbi:MAG: GMC family oxidoreductase [Chromatiaceae bacterium]